MYIKKLERKDSFRDIPKEVNTKSDENLRKVAKVRIVQLLCMYVYVLYATFYWLFQKTVFDIFARFSYFRALSLELYLTLFSVYIIYTLHEMCPPPPKKI